MFPVEMKNNKELQPSGNRFNNYDFLRIISAIAVIFIHVNWHYFGSRAKTPSLNISFLVESTINIIMRFSVPSFVMISGAFNLKKEENENCLVFYKKSIWKIFLPAILAIVIFLCLDSINVLFFGQNRSVSIDEILAGNYYNLWFIYMLAGLYLLTPFIIKLKSQLNEKTYIIASSFILLWAVRSQAVSNQSAAYAMGVVFAFLGYYLVGDIILNYVNLQHKPFFYYTAAGIMFVLTFIARFMGATYYLSNAYTNFFSPFITIASLCIFAAVKNSNVKKNWSWLAGKTFYIYIFHTIVYTYIFDVFESLGIVGSEIVRIFIISALTFLISLIIAIFYDKFWSSLITVKKKYDSLKIWDNEEIHTHNV